VSNHLAHVYAKFGVASRAELTAFLTTATTDRPGFETGSRPGDAM
jgi:hypothetical protein